MGTYHLHTARRSRAALALAVMMATTVVLVPARLAAAGTELIWTVAGNGSPGSAGDGGQATAAQLNQPQDVAVDAAGNRYIADSQNHKVRKVDPSGVITTFAGTGTPGGGGDGGSATLAQLNVPTSVAVDAAGNVYIADSATNRVRRVDTSGVIANFAGSGRFGCRNGGDFKGPTGLAVDGSGVVYVTDLGCDRVRKVVAGVITNIAGVLQPRALALDASGNLYVTSDQAGVGVQRIDPAGAVTPFACTGAGGDGGPAVSASCDPRGVAVDGAGNVYLAEVANKVRKIDPGGVISTFAGTGLPGYSGDGGPATSAQLQAPSGLEVSGPVLYVADRSNHAVRKIANPPPAPAVTGTVPASPANDNAPRVVGTAAAGSTVRLYTNAACTSAVAGTGSAAAFASPGISVAVTDNTTATFWANVTDDRGTSLCSTTSTDYVEDSTPPAVPTVTGPAPNPGSDAAPTWSFSGEAGGGFECQLTRGSVLVASLAACSSPKSYNLGAQPDGTYTLSVRKRDAAGNTSAFVTSDYALDRSAPAVPAVTPPAPNPGMNASPVWSFTGEAAATFECQLTRGATTIAALAACSSPKSYALAAQPDGVYTFSVRQRDAAGNTSAFATSNYTLDRAAGAPTITAAPGSAGNSVNPAWSFTGEPGSTFECRLVRGATTVSALAACSSPKSYNLSAEADGTYTFSVRQRDIAGNTSAFASFNYTLDRGVPATPAVTAPSPNPGTNSNPAWSFTGEAGAAFECQLTRGATVISGLVACSSPNSFALTAQPDGVYTLSVRQRDAAGNTSTFATSSYILDRTAPAAPSLGSGPGPTGSDSTPTWAFTGEAGAIFQCELSRGATVLSAYAACASPHTYALSQGDGTYTFSVRQRDAAGNIGPSAASNYVLDQSAPAPPTVVAPAPNPGTNASPTWSFSGEAGATFECELVKASAVVSPFAPCTTPRSYSLTNGDGTYTLNVRQRDAAGNTSPPAGSSYTLDRAAPSSPGIDAGPGTTGSDSTPSWSFSGESGATFECELSKGPTVLSPFATCTSPQTYTLTQGDGTYTFKVRQRDQAGNLSAAAARDYALELNYPGAVQGDAPSSYWRLNETSGTTAVDSQGVRDGTYTNGVTLGVGGIAGGVAAGFDGVDDRIDVGDVYDFANKSSFSVESWVKRGSDGEADTWRWIATKNDVSDPREGWVVVIAPDTSSAPQRVLFERWRGGSVDAVYGTTPLRADTWYHVVTTYGADTMQVYVNGVLEATAPSTLSLSDTNLPLKIGHSATAATNYYDGRIDEVAVYPKALSASEVLNHFWAGTATFNGTNPPSGSNDNAPRVRGTALASSTVRLYTDPACSSPVAATGTGSDLLWPGLQVSVPDDSTTTYYATVTAGAVTSPCSASSVTYLEDSAAAPPAVTGPAPDPSSYELPEWSFVGEPGATFQCELSSAGAVVFAFSPCTSPVSHDLRSQPDGTYTFSVRQVDAAGNASATATEDYTLDRALPAPPTITSGPGAYGTGATPAWSFSGEAGSSFECRLSRGGTPVFALAGCSAPKAYDLGAQPDGTYTFSVRQADAAGNTSAFTTSDYTLDRSLPAPPAITSGPGAAGAGTAPSWSFSGEQGATFECQLSQAAGVVSAFAPCSSPHAYDLSSQADGTYTFSVRQADAAGNTSAATTSDYTLDRAVPAAPTVTGPVPDPGTDTHPTWSFTGEPGAGFDCRLTSGAGEVSPLSPCTSSHAYDLGSLPDGTYTLSVRQSDAAGNTSAFASSDYTLDRVAPPAPVVTAPSPNPGGDARPRWSFTGEPGAAFECQLNQGANVIEAVAPCATPITFDLGPRPDGTYTLSVRQADAAGNKSAFAISDYTLDRATPAPPTVTGPSPNPGNGTGPSWSFTGETGAGFECGLSSGPSEVVALTSCASPESYDLGPRPDGTYTFSVRQTDTAGNTSAFSTSDYTLDRTDPLPPTVTPPSPSPGNDPTPTWFITGEAGSSFECRLDRGATVVDPLGPCASAATYDLGAEADGTYTLWVRQRDAAGNFSTYASADHSLDRSSPAPPVMGPGPGPAGSDATPTWTFSGEAGAVFHCELRRGTTVVSARAACGSPKTFDLSDEPDAVYTLFVTQTDAAGNVSPPTSSDYGLARPAPPPGPSSPDPGSPGPGSSGLAGGTTAPMRAQPSTSDGASAEALDGGPPGGAAIGSGGGPAVAVGSPPAQASQRGPAPGQSRPLDPRRSPGANRADEGNIALEILAEVAGKTAFPAALLVIVMTFMAIQDRIDRNDPKLALAPVRSESLDFIDPA